MHDIYHDVQINKPIDFVFKAISSPTHLINWWPLECSGNPELGKIFNFNFTDEYNWFGKISKIEPNKAFYIKMTDSDQDWNPTTFGFNLITNDSGTLIEFSHTGWPENNHHYRRSSYCWAILLQGLKSYLEDDLVIPFENRA